MQPTNIKLLPFLIALSVFMCVAFLLIAAAPNSSHHLLLVIALTLSYLGTKSLLKYKSRNDWIERTAVIKEIRECEEDVAISQYTSVTYYYPAIEYEYYLGGDKHLGSNVSLEKEGVWVPGVNAWGDVTPEGERWWLALKSGDEHPVFVNPRDEDESVLIRDLTGARRSHHMALLVGGSLVGLIWLLVVAQAIPS